MNPDTMEFKTTMFLPNTTVATGQLCPNMRRMPQVGSILAEIAAMALLLAKLPIVILTSAPVITQLLTGPCFLDAKSHSLLMNCGQELFSLEEFFESAYTCNAHFWRSLAIIADYMQPGFAQTFLNGLTAMGENSGASAFVPGTMGTLAKLTSNDPFEGITKLQELMSGGARFGSMGMFMKTTLNPIAGTHWIWRMGSRMIIQIIEAANRQRSVGSVFWNVLYDGRLDYTELVAKRMLNTCGGFSLMAGYTSTPLGNMILHYCFAGVKSTVATLDLMSVFMVDLPIVVCVCRQTSGNNPANWILQNCDAPDGLKPLLRTLMHDPFKCRTLVEQTKANLTGVFNDTFGELFAGTTSVGSVLDSVLSLVDSEKAGKCDNFDSNPYVVTLIPQPVDYWRACGTTDLCRLRCQQQIEAFEAVRPSSDTARSMTYDHAVQSLFFPTLNADAFNPFRSMNALSELKSCIGLCPNREDRCFLATGFVGGSGVLRVAQFCVPSALAQGVSRGGSWDTIGISGQSVEIQLIRIPGKGWTDSYGVVGIQKRLVQVCLQIDCVEFTPESLGSNVLTFEQMQTLDSVTVVQARTQASGMASYCLRFLSKWDFALCSGTNVFDFSPYYLVMTSQNQVLVLPFDNTPMRLCALNVAQVALVGCAEYQGFEHQNVPVRTRGLQPRVSQYASVDYHIFIASNEPSNWLTMLFISTQNEYASSSLANSMTVSIQYTLKQQCKLDSCIGCTQLAVQRLCYAAQQCQVARCIGTQVNQLRPLCAIGGAVESGCFTHIAALHGIWNMISSTLADVIEATGGISAPMSITWPDQAFYGIVCTQKDVIASTVSILTAAINGVVQASLPAIMLASGNVVDNRFLATFTLTMMAVTEFLFQLALLPLYVAIGFQKVVVCQVNSLIAVVTGNNAITIGDPDLQSATSVASGVCMSQVFTENAQSLNNGMDNDQAFASGTTQVLSRLGRLSMQLQLDALIHPVDVLFTYLLGVVIGLQDVLQTVDQKK